MGILTFEERSHWFSHTKAMAHQMQATLQTGLWVSTWGFQTLLFCLGQISVWRIQNKEMLKGKIKLERNMNEVE